MVPPTAFIPGIPSSITRTIPKAIPKTIPAIGETAEAGAAPVEAVGEVAAKEEATSILATRLAGGARAVAPYAAPVAGLATEVYIGHQMLTDNPLAYTTRGDTTPSLGDRFFGLTPERLNRLGKPTLDPIDPASARIASNGDNRLIRQAFLPQARALGFNFPDNVTADQFRNSLHDQAKKMGISIGKNTTLQDLLNEIKFRGGVQQSVETVITDGPALKAVNINRLNPNERKLIEGKIGQYQGEIADLTNQLTTKSYKGKAISPQNLQNVEKEYERAQRELRRLQGHSDFATFNVNRIVPLDGAKPAPTTEKGGLLKPPSLVDGGTSGNKGTAPKPASVAGVTTPTQRAAATTQTTNAGVPTPTPKPTVTTQTPVAGAPSSTPKPAVPTLEPATAASTSAQSQTPETAATVTPQPQGQAPAVTLDNEAVVVTGTRMNLLTEQAPVQAAQPKTPVQRFNELNDRHTALESARQQVIDGKLTLAEYTKLCEEYSRDEKEYEHDVFGTK